MIVFWEGAEKIRATREEVVEGREEPWSIRRSCSRKQEANSTVWVHRTIDFAKQFATSLIQGLGAPSDEMDLEGKGREERELDLSFNRSDKRLKSDMDGFRSSKGRINKGTSYWRCKDGEMNQIGER